MEPISTGSDTRFYFQVGKMKINEGIKCLQDLVEWCKNNLSPENGGILCEIMAYLQSLQPQVREIECVAQQGGAAPASFNVHGTDLQHGQVIESLALQGDAFVSNTYVNEQEITQIGEQNVNFKPSPNLEINMGMNKKRKLRSDVWNHFAKYENEDKKVRAQCQHCKKDFDGSSKSGTTHLRNHLKSCLKNQSTVADKMKEMSVVDQELHDSNFMQKIIKQLNDTFEVYKEQKNKLHRCLEKLPGRFFVTIEELMEDFGVEFVMIWFIDENWKLKKRIIHLEHYDSDEEGLNEDSLKRLIQDWNIDKRILSMVDRRVNPSEGKIQPTNWLNERASLPFIENYETCYDLLLDFESEVDLVMRKSDIMCKVRKLKDYYMTSSNKCKFESAVKKVESMGRKVTSKYNDVSPPCGFKLCDWAMGYKEVFCELERIDPDFTSINFDWHEATSLHSFWVVFEDMKNDIQEVRDSKLANECFLLVDHLFDKMLRFKNTENQYFDLAALRYREIFDEYCNNSKLVIVITVILDPRYKQDIVEKFYKEVYNNEAGSHLKKIMDDVTNIYNEYARDVNNSSMVRAYAVPHHANEVASSKSEFDRYLTDSKVPPHEGFDILEWWRFNSTAYPTLATMARDFLSLPSGFGVPDDDFIDVLGADAEDICRNVDFKCVLACIKVWLNAHEIIAWSC